MHVAGKLGWRRWDLHTVLPGFSRLLQPMQAELTSRQSFVVCGEIYGAFGILPEDGIKSSFGNAGG